MKRRIASMFVIAMTASEKVARATLGDGGPRAHSGGAWGASSVKSASGDQRLAPIEREQDQD